MATDAHRGWHRRGRERGVAAVDATALAVAVAAAVVALGAVLAGSGGEQGARIESTLRAAAEAPEQLAATRGSRETRRVEGVAAGSGRVPNAREVRLPRHDARWPLAWWQAGRSGRVSREVLGGVASASGSVRACVACLDGSWGGDASASLGADGQPGIDASAQARAQVGIAAVEAAARAEYGRGPARAHVAGELHGLAGADANARASLALQQARQQLELRAGARAGLVGRAEQEAGVDLGLVAIEQAVAAEGWVGAGLRGEVDVGHEDGQLRWKVGGGAALGLGGALEWESSIDVGRIDLADRRRLRQLTLAAITPGAWWLALR